MRSAVVWDFDWSLINENTDTWVFQEQPDGAESMRYLKERLAAKIQWTRLMDEMLARHHARGGTVESLNAALRRIPVFPEHIEAVKLVK